MSVLFLEAAVVARIPFACVFFFVFFDSEVREVVNERRTC